MGSTNQISSQKSSQQAEQILEAWFKNCPVWEKQDPDLKK
jgi:hypothetical protein